MASISEKEIRKAVKGILKGADLSTLSVKKIRLKLENKFDADFSDRKKEVDGIVMELLAAGNESGEEETKPEVKESKKEKKEETKKEKKEEKRTEKKEENRVKPEESKPSKKDDKTDDNVKDNGKEESGSDDSSDSEDDDLYSDEGGDGSTTPPRKKAKRLKKEQEKRELAMKLAAIGEDFDPEDPDRMDDEEIARQLQDEETGPRRSGRLGRRPMREKKRKEPKEKGERKGKGYGAPCHLSPALAEILGTDKMPRCDVVKKMYEIAKEKNLLDPKNKQFMICNDELMKVFGKKRVRMFGMMKHLTDHITDPHRMTNS